MELTEWYSSLRIIHILMLFNSQYPFVSIRISSSVEMIQITMHDSIPYLKIINYNCLILI